MKKLLILLLLLCNFAAAHASVPYLEKVHPDYRPVAQSFKFHFTSDKDIAAAADLQVSKATGRETIFVPATDTSPEIPLYIYRPAKAADKNLPVIYYSHGGGFLFRLALDHTVRYQNLADQTGAIVVTPQYRLSTEAPFPAALNDAYSALLYIYRNASALNMDSSRIVLMGDSAGGGLSASLALYNRDHDQIPLRGQVLIYPMLDYRTGTSDSPYHNIYSGYICWDRQTNVFAWNKLKGQQNISGQQLTYFSPALAENLSNLPPAMIYVGSIDLFVNEDIDYANRLIAAGNDTTLHVVPGLYHAFDIVVPNAQPSKVFWQTIYENARQMLSDK